MRKTQLVAFLAVLSISAIALAASPHFTRSAGTVDNSGNLAVTFKEAGLGSNQNINFLLTANATAYYGCLNKGGKNPSASNKRTVQQAVSKPGSFSSGKNGQISATLTLNPPPKPSDFSCPGGQKLVLAYVAYTNVVLKDTTTPVTANVSGTFTKTWYNFK